MEVKEKNLSSLELDNELIGVLNNKGLYTINDVWVLKRSDLKSIGVKDSQINQLSIKLQLLGLDLNKKVYRVKR